MRPISQMPRQTAAAIDLVLADIDDTLTTDGRLPAIAYSALETLKAAGLAVAAVTGRPAGWCDMIARFWPVDGVVGENGALYFAYEPASRTMRRVYSASAEERADNRAKLARIQARVIAEVPGTAVAADQAYREADLAIDFCEDVAPLGREAAERIKAIFEEEGAVARISSIHVNGWFGAYDKLTMTRRFAREVLDSDLDAVRDRVLYVGDSPNDASMFAQFPNACGVANVREFLGLIEAEPTWIAKARGGEGFAEIATIIVDARNHLRKTA